MDDTSQEMEDNPPPPAPPVGKKSDIFDPDKFKDIDKRASEAPGTLSLSFPELITYLTDGLTSDLQKLRSLFMWVGTKELLDESVYELDVPDTTPYYYLKAITESGGASTNLPLLFALLCKLAGIPTQIVEGFTKRDVSFTVGDNIEEPNYRWIAVYVDGSWRIVDIRLAFLGVRMVAPDWVLVEDSGQAVRERPSGEPTAVRVQYINERCFLPDPEDFIYLCYPKDPAWQLLAEPWSKEKFIKTPAVTWKYLGTAWHLAEKHEAIVEAPGGRCCVSMDQMPEEQCAIRYKLFYNEKRSKKRFPDKLQLDNFVKTVRSKGQLSVTTRLPETGIYLLKIMDGEKEELCELLIKSTGKTKAAVPFPPIPDTGLGFSQAAIDAGLVDPSREDGLVVAREGDKVRFRFRTKKPMEIVTRLVHSVLPSQQLDHRVALEEENGVITINVKVPWHANNPEFSLQVDAKPKDSEEEQLVNVLNYLLTSDRELVHSIKGQEQQLREDLEAAMADDDVHRLEGAIREFRSGHVKDDDLYAKACRRLVDVHRSAVESAKNDEAKLAAALKDADESQVAYMLHRSEWLAQAEETYRRMRRLSCMRHKVQNLSGKQVSEIQTYNHPHAGVRAVVMATYILLGEDSKTVKKWKKVQALLRRHGRQSIIQLIKNHDVSKVDKKHLDSALSLLNSCTSEELPSVSVSAAAFYEWSKAVVDSMVEEKKNDNAITTQHDRDDDGTAEDERKNDNNDDNDEDQGTTEQEEEE
ncbi:hillarin-like [Babylonia areolata]|uniref:hillarin-like n=1 Tax=Babylonia areolata TaxID=304850 RepID=UPI003FD68E3C